MCVFALVHVYLEVYVLFDLIKLNWVDPFNESYLFFIIVKGLKHASLKYALINYLFAHTCTYMCFCTLINYMHIHMCVCVCVFVNMHVT